MFYYLILAAVAVRLGVQAVTEGFQPLVQFALLAAFLLLSLLQPVVHRRLPSLAQLLLALAAGAVTGMLFTLPRKDYYCLLYSLSASRSPAMCRCATAPTGWAGSVWS
jgi:hypothetical protein